MSQGTAAAASSAPPAAAVVLRVIWLAILLGLAVQVCVLVGATAAGASLPRPAQLAAEAAQRTSWSVLVCAALAFGAAFSRGGAVGTGLAGLLGAPAAFIVARAVQKGVHQALQQGAVQVAATPAATIAILKAAEYGALGAAVAWAVSRFGGGLRVHVLCGLGAGIVFGGATLAILSPMPPSAWVSRGINEVLFPVGCSLALYLARAFVGQRQPVEISD